MVSAAYKASFYAAETDDDTVTLVKVEHPMLSEPIRVAHSFSNVTSGGEIYASAAFRAQLPEQAESMAPRAQLVVENVDREMVESLRAASGLPRVTITEVLKSDPDIVEDIYPELDVIEVEYDATQIAAEIGYPDLDQQAFGPRFMPSLWTGL